MADSMDKKYSNVPNLRFSDCEWKECTIASISSVVTKQTGFDYANTIKKSLVQERTEKTLPYIQTKNFHDKEINYDTDYFIPIDVASQFIKINLNVECVLMSIVGASVGNIGYFDHKQDAFLSGAICVIKSDDFFNLKRVYHYMHSEYGQKQIATTTKGAAQATITIEDIRSYKIRFPSSINDEIKLYSLLDLIDSRIDTQNKIISAKKSLMKNIVVEMKNDSASSVALSSIAEIYQPQTLAQNELIPGDYYVYGANGIIGKHNRYNHENEEICLTCRGSTCGNLCLSKPFSWINGNAMVIKTNNNINKHFIYYALLKINWSKYISGSGQPQIVRSAIQNIRINLPDIEIQNKISIVLDTLNDSIEAELLLLNKLNELKRYLLSNLFI